MMLFIEYPEAFEALLMELRRVRKAVQLTARRQLNRQRQAIHPLAQELL